MTAVLTRSGGAGGGVAYAWPPTVDRYTETNRAWSVDFDSYVPVFRAREGGVNEMRTRSLLGKKIAKIGALQDGWRGPGSEAPSRAALNLYLTAYRELHGRDLWAAEPTPTSDGGIHMEWKSGELEYSAEVSKDGALILNVFALDESDDIERVIESPRPSALINFIKQGVHGIER